ncbi:hypothetical protein NA78x_004790 [Anatilimnocola sp. NA78]|uniref:hypothetical protein n=1 Tax=Anatilimnocola sp. NA78 TaxID=3415683 RepID=UPI003CE4BB90
MDAVLGRCEVQMPVAEQGRLGVIEFQAMIEGHDCLFQDTFCEDEDRETAIEQCLMRLRVFYRLANNPEQMKSCRNILIENMDFHRTLYPKVRLSEDELKAGARLTGVAVNDGDEAWFKFFHPNFMEGRTITIEVDADGTASNLGVS